MVCFLVDDLDELKVLFGLMKSSSEELKEVDSLEQQCVKLAQSGSREAFAVLVQHHQAAVFALIVRRGISQAVAKELTQDVLLKAYLNINTYRAQASFRTWLLRIAVNHTTNYFHSRAYKEGLKTDQKESDSLPQKEADGFDSDALKHLQALVFELPTHLQEVMVLFAFEQHGYEEIAAVLEIPIGTVRSRIYRARAQLKKAYFSDEEEV